MLLPEDAWSRLEPLLAPLPAERVERAAARGRVLAAPLAATTDLPADDVSALDGYAYQGDLAPASELPIAFASHAGGPPTEPLPAGSAAWVATGAVVPRGADRVVAVEATARAGGHVRLETPVSVGAGIRRRAEALARGAPLLPPGLRLGAGALSLLASQGIASLLAHRPPRVALLATGDEVLPPEAEPGPGQLRDSHTDFLLAALATLGIRGRSLGIARDDADELTTRIAGGMDADVLLTCGGVSMGDTDFTEQALTALGCELLFDAVAIQPGKPLVAAHRPGTLIFGLPGNPASVMVAFWLFVAPALRRLAGCADGFWQGAESARLATPIEGAKGRDRFLPAAWTLARGELVVAPRDARGSHDLPAFATATALVRVPAGSPPRAAGERCEILRLDL